MLNVFDVALTEMVGTYLFCAGLRIRIRIVFGSPIRVKSWIRIQVNIKVKFLELTMAQNVALEDLKTSGRRFETFC